MKAKNMAVGAEVVCTNCEIKQPCRLSRVALSTGMDGEDGFAVHLPTRWALTHYCFSNGCFQTRLFCPACLDSSTVTPLLSKVVTKNFDSMVDATLSGICTKCGEVSALKYRVEYASWDRKTLVIVPNASGSMVEIPQLGEEGGIASEAGVALCMACFGKAVKYTHSKPR